MDTIDRVMKVLVTKTGGGLNIHLLLSQQMMESLLAGAVAATAADKETSASVVRTFGNSKTGIARIRVETCKPEFKGRSHYARAVMDAEGDEILLVTTL